MCNVSRATAPHSSHRWRARPSHLFRAPQIFRAAQTFSAAQTLLLCLFVSGCVQRPGQRTAPTVEHRFELQVDPSVVDKVEVEGTCPGLPLALGAIAPGHFRAHINGLHAGQSYRYRFRVHRRDLQRWITLADPKAWQLDASAERWGLFSAGVAHPTRPRPFEAPPLGDLVIYELNPREYLGPLPFSALDAPAQPGALGQSFRRIAALIATGYYQQLGINALELMPVLAQGWRRSAKGGPPVRTPWGYQALSWFAINGDFGSAADFGRLVDTAHAKGLAVIVDVSFDHGYGGALHGLVTDLFPRWRVPSPQNPWGLLELDVAKEPAARSFAIAALRRLLVDFNVDGLRLDWTEKVPTTVWKQVVQEVRKFKPGALLISENPKAEFVVDAGFDAVWDFFFHWEAPLLLREVYRNHDGYTGRLVNTQRKLVENIRSRAFPPHGAMNHAGIDTRQPPPVVRYIESHDLPRIARREVKWQHGGNHVLDVDGDGKTPDLLAHGSARKSRLGATLLATLPGAIMLFGGQEFGADDELVWAFDPLRWPPNPVVNPTFKHYQKVLSVRRQYAAARSNDLRILLNDSEQGLLVYSRGSDPAQPDDDTLIVALNFSNRPVSAKIELCPATQWTSIVGAPQVQRGTQLLVALEASSASILARVRHAQASKPVSTSR